MNKLGTWGIGLGVLLVGMTMLAGCGDSASNDKTSAGDTLQLEAGAGIATVSDSASLDDASAFKAGDLPVDAGRQLVYAANAPDKTATIYFDLDGPWRFSSGPEQASLTINTTTKDNSPGSSEFPEAAFVIASSISTNAGVSEYVFESRDDGAWYSYGRITSKGATVIYTAPSKAMVFPMHVGDSWTDGYSEIGGSQTTEVTAENTVIANNELIVPAGSFNAWLLQTKVIAKSSSSSSVTIDYSWFVPGVGRAAEIVSKPGEDQLPFSTARAFYRLKSFK